jgi:tetratricopeptide (TPR) repeat protein
MRALLLLSLLVPGIALGDFQADFKKTRESDDHAAMIQLLAGAEKTEQENPDYYALASNYWWQFASEINISTKPAAKGDPSLREPDSDKEVGSISSNGDLDPSLRKKALALTAEGFRRFPQRLDIGFGLAQVQFKTGDARASVATLREILKISSAPGAKLKWTANADLPEPAATFVPESIQGYTAPLFRQETPEADALCKELLDATVAAFPAHPFAYNLLAALADAKGDKDESYRLLKVAAEKAPEDTLILFNLAEAHAARGKKADAAATYRKVIVLEPDEATEAAAKEALEALEDDKVE